MSERKSWDIQPARKASPAAAPAPRREPARKAPSARPKRVTTRPARLPAGSLKQRRARKRRTARYVFLTLLLILIAAGLYIVWMPAFRIHQVEASGPSADAAKLVVKQHLVGTFAYIIPRDSVFFYPKEKVRSAILDASPEVSAVSLTRTSFSSISVETTPRAKAFIWCGTSIDTPIPDGSCYDADIDGLIFMKDPSTVSSTIASSTPTVQGDVRVFGALDRNIPAGGSAVRAHMTSANYLPNALKFVDAIRELKAPVSALAIRGDEADLWLSGPTRITYVLGHESDAALLAASTLPTISLTDGTINYIDLRFPGKAYIGRYGE